MHNFIYKYELINNKIMQKKFFLAIIAIYVALYYVRFTIFDFEAPDPFLSEPSGWWTWWDQSQYLLSAEALFAGNLHQGAHWYPFGYPILGALFVKIFPAHPFIFVNTICLLLTIWLFLHIAKEFSISPITAFVLFGLSVFSEIQVFRQWVIPWNTTPAVVYIYAVLFILIRKPAPDLRAMLLVGLCSALIPATRLAETLLIFGLDVMIAIRCWIELPRFEALKRLGAACGAAAVTIVFFLILHVHIYGFHFSPYQLLALGIGNNYSQIAQKLYALIIDPKPVWLEGHGMAQHAPWWILALSGSIIALYTRSYRFLAVFYVIITNVFSYTVFGDMYPTGLWRYNNIHYFKLVYPLVMLAAWIGLVEALRNRVAFILTLSSILVLLSIRLERVPVAVSAKVMDMNRLEVEQAGKAPFRTLVLDGVPARFDDVYFLPHIIEKDGNKLCQNMVGCRFVAQSGRVVIVFDNPVEAGSLSIRFDPKIILPEANTPLQSMAYQHMFRLGHPRLPGW